MALLEKRPDCVVVLLRHREIAATLIGRLAPVLFAVPVHPVAEANRLLSLNPGELVYTRLAFIDKLVDGREAIAGDQVFDVALRLKFQFLFDFDLDPQALAIETILIALIAAVHREITLVAVLISTAPGVMDAHRIIGGDWPVQKRPTRFAAILLAKLAKGVNLLPVLKNRPLLGGKIDGGFDFVEGHEKTSRRQLQKRYSISKRKKRNRGRNMAFVMLRWHLRGGLKPSPRAKELRHASKIVVVCS